MKSQFNELSRLASFPQFYLVISSNLEFDQQMRNFSLPLLERVINRTVARCAPAFSQWASSFNYKVAIKFFRPKIFSILFSLLNFTSGTAAAVAAAAGSPQLPPVVAAAGQQQLYLWLLLLWLPQQEADAAVAIIAAAAVIVTGTVVAVAASGCC